MQHFWANPLGWIHFSLSLSAYLCIHFYWLSWLRLASHRTMIQSSTLRLRRFKILTCPLLKSFIDCFHKKSFGQKSINLINFDSTLQIPYFQLNSSCIQIFRSAYAIYFHNDKKISLLLLHISPFYWFGDNCW